MFASCSSRRLALLAALVPVLATTTGCAPLLLAGVAGGGAALSDRRTIGAQVDDQTIEKTARERLDGLLGSQHNVGITAFNRALLLTGSVPTQAKRQAVAKAVSGIEGLAALYDEVVVRPGALSLSGEAKDSALTVKVKAALLQAPDLPLSAVKVVSSDSRVYLLGKATAREKQRAAAAARAVSGVERVILVMETIPEAELARAAR